MIVVNKKHFFVGLGIVGSLVAIAVFWFAYFQHTNFYVSLFQTGATNVTCQLTPGNYTAIYTYPGLGSDPSNIFAGSPPPGGATTVGPFGFVLPAGSYHITLVSYDDHSEQNQGDQVQEYYHAILYGQQGTEIIRTSNSDDIPDNQQYQTTVLPETYTTTEASTVIFGQHGSDGTVGGWNSHMPVCVGFAAIATSTPTPISGGIQGRFVHDTSADGTAQVGEKFLLDPSGPAGCVNEERVAGFSVTYTGQATGTASLNLCNAGGPAYVIGGIPDGNYVLTGHVPSGWHFTGPTTASVYVENGVAKTAAGGAAVDPWFFATQDAVLGGIQGRFVHDTSADGVVQAGEKFILDTNGPAGACVNEERVAGFSVTYTGPSSGTALLNLCNPTGPAYVIGGLADGTYTLTGHAASGWHFTNSAVTQTVTIANGAANIDPWWYVTQNAALGGIQGRFVHDTNSNATADSGEKFLLEPTGPVGCVNEERVAGFSITYTGPSSGTAYVNLCNSTGPAYVIGGLANGTYTLTGHLASGWHFTTSSAVQTVTITNGAGNIDPWWYVTQDATPTPTPTGTPTPTATATATPTQTAVPAPTVALATCTLNTNTITWTGSPIVATNNFGIAISTDPTIPNSNVYTKFVAAPNGAGTYSTNIPDGMTLYQGTTALTFVSGTTYYVRVNNGQQGAITTFTYQAPQCAAGSIAVTKSANPNTLGTGGGNVTYSYTVRSTEGGTLTNVQVSDNLCSPLTRTGGDANNNSILESTETWTYTCNRNITTSTTNVATAQGVNSQNQTVSANASAFVPVQAANLNFGLEKLGLNVTRLGTVPQNRIDAAPNDILQFTLNVDSQSGTTLTNVIIRDVLPSELTYEIGTTRVNGVAYPDGITANGLTIGIFPAGNRMQITFNARLRTTEAFQSGTTIVVNAATARADGVGERESRLPIYVSKNLLVPVGKVQTGVNGFTLTLILSLFLTFGYYLVQSRVLKLAPSTNMLVVMGGLLILLAGSMGIASLLDHSSLSYIELRSPAIHNNSGNSLANFGKQFFK